MFNKFFLFLFLINGGVLAFSVSVFADYYDYVGILLTLALFVLPLALVYLFGRAAIDRKEKNRLIPFIFTELIAGGMIVFIVMVYSILGLGAYTEYEKKILVTFAFLMSIPFFSYIASGIFLVFYNIKTGKKST